ncbi:MAG: thiamine pyrophosphate-binding protein [Pseudomonadota bacterium]
MRHGGLILIHQLKVQGCQRVFCVPGESYLAVLDALYDVGQIQTITCRHESGAAMMAQAYGKLHHQPGVCFVTRGPGASNAAIGLHIAQQDSTPMLLFVGMPARAMRDRETFQEFDLKGVFGTIAKDVIIIDEAVRIPELIARAYHISVAGRPGPVVIGLPEDMLRDRSHTADCTKVKPVKSAPSRSDMIDFQKRLESANRPLMIVGGPNWSQEIAENLMTVAEQFNVPVVTSFRSQDYIDNRHPNFAGDVGIAINPKLAECIAEADLIIAFGSRLGEITTQGYTLIQAPQSSQSLIHIHSDPNELGKVYQADLSIVSDPEHFASALGQLKKPQRNHWPEWCKKICGHYKTYIKPVTTPGDVKMEYIINVLNDVLPENAIVTNGAGNYTAWLHRYFQYKRYGTQLAPRAGAMGYGLPAAICAKLSYPDNVVVCLAGDGCFMMTAQELATAVHYGVPVIVLVVNNRMYGTIRMHQEKSYPGRVLGTSLTNPDFAKFASSFGAHGEVIEHRRDFRAALKRAIKAKVPSVIELQVDEMALTPSKTLTEISESFAD